MANRFGIFGEMDAPVESKFILIPKLFYLLSAFFILHRNQQDILDHWKANRLFIKRSPEDICRRLDQVIAEIREKYHRPAFEATNEEDAINGDVLVVAHGHILRAFAMRWIGKPLFDTAFILEAGGVGTLR